MSSARGRAGHEELVHVVYQIVHTGVVHRNAVLVDHRHAHRAEH